MKYAPKAVFIKTTDGYEEISYDELLCRTKADAFYEDKLFLPLYGVLMEVSKKDYAEFYRMRRRQKYIDECSEENGDISYDMLSTDDFSGEEILIDESQNVAETVERKIMLDKLRQIFPMLKEDEQKLIKQHFFDGISETELAPIYGITQQGISKRIKKICAKIKNF